MRNVWKGLVIGGLTGALAGVLLDAGDRASRLANQDVRRASRAARRAMERAELPGRVRSVTRRAFSADTAEQARDLAGRAASSARRRRHPGRGGPAALGRRGRPLARRRAPLNTDPVRPGRGRGPERTGRANS